MHEYSVLRRTIESLWALCGNEHLQPESFANFVALYFYSVVRHRVAYKRGFRSNFVEVFCLHTDSKVFG
jgi:hypothetical protein